MIALEPWRPWPLEMGGGGGMTESEMGGLESKNKRDESFAGGGAGLDSVNMDCNEGT